MFVHQDGYSDMAIMANRDIALVYERGDSDYQGENNFRIVKNPLSYRN
ncbi:MAG: sialidase family protein [Bacilli bacterium]